MILTTDISGIQRPHCLDLGREFPWLIYCLNAADQYYLSLQSISQKDTEANVSLYNDQDLREDGLIGIPYQYQHDASDL